MSNRAVFKYGLYGRCPVCKEITKERCQYCESTDSFADSGKAGFVYCTNCNTLNKIDCKNPDCNFQLKSLKTPTNQDEKDRIDQYIKRKELGDKENRRNYTIKESENTKTKISSTTDVDIVDFNKKTPEGKTRDQQEAELIKKFWGSKDLNFDNENADIKKESQHSETEKEKEERRIVNRFYDEDNAIDIDKKIHFKTTYDETVFFDCQNCGNTEIKIVCEKCNSSNKFSLDYDSLNCECGNHITVVSCPSCQSKYGQKSFYLLSDNIKWRYSRSKSYYNYRKGRMLAFSECPSCGLFAAERCVKCGSKVNFGKSNKEGKVYCKNCGTINQFVCSNPKCKDAVKHIKTPSSIQENLDWLKKVKNFKKFYLEQKDKPSTLMSSSFLDTASAKNAKNISTSFISEFEEELADKTQTQSETVSYSKPQEKNTITVSNKKKNKKYEVHSFGSEYKKRNPVKIILNIIIIIIILAFIYDIYLLYKEKGALDMQIIIDHFQFWK